MIKTIGDCVARNRYAQAMRWKRRKLITFNDVDIAIPVERTVGGKGVPLALLIKQTNIKSARDIHHEIESARQKVDRGRKRLHSEPTSILQARAPAVLFRAPVYSAVSVETHIHESISSERELGYGHGDDGQRY